MNYEIEISIDGKKAWACFAHGKYAVCLWPQFKPEEYQRLRFIRWLVKEGKVVT